MRFWVSDLSSGAIDLAAERFGDNGQLWPSAITDGRVILGVGAEVEDAPGVAFLYDAVSQRELPIRDGPAPDPRGRFLPALSADGQTLTFSYNTGASVAGQPLLQVYAQRR